MAKQEEEKAETTTVTGGTAGPGTAQPYIAKIVEAPAEDEPAVKAEPIKVPRGKTALVYGGPGAADALDLGDGRVVRPGDTLVASGDEGARFMALGGFSVYTPPAAADDDDKAED